MMQTLETARNLDYTRAKPRPSRRGHCLKKTGGGLGLPIDSAAQSRNTALVCGFIHSGPVYGGLNVGPQGRRHNSSAGSPVVQPVQAAAQIGLWTAVLPTDPLEPIMAEYIGASAPFSIIPNRFPGERLNCDITALPFVCDVKVAPRRKQRSYWHVPDLDYASGNVVGAQYGADFVQYLQDNPDSVGMGYMSAIAEHMYSTARTVDQHQGVAVGFWSIIEKALLRSRLDHYATAQMTADFVASLLTRKE
jgi:hypothetical protein